MRQILGCAAAILASAALTASAQADEAEILSHYDAYDAAFAAGDFATADMEGEAAWRAAEAEWGAREETGVLAFNLARLRLMMDHRAEALEPSQRVAELVEAGATTSVSPEEATLFVRISQLGDDPGRRELNDLEEALAAYEPVDPMNTHITWMALARVADRRIENRQWREAFEAADRAGQLMADDPSAAAGSRARVALLAASAAYEREDYVDAIRAARRGIAAYPPQPLDQPVDPILGSLLGWEAGLRNAAGQFNKDLSELNADVYDPAWDDGRYPTAMGCDVEWIERSAPNYPSEGARRGQVLGMMFEYYLDTDGSVIRVDPLGDIRDTGGFGEAAIEAMHTWRATPQPRAECRGPWQITLEFRLQTRTAQSR